MGKTAFALQFDPSLLPRLAKRYKASMPGEDEAFAAGRRIGQGDHSLQNLRPIVDWKSERSKGRVAKNDERDVADALRLALDAKTDGAAVSVLLGLRGVQVPIASAILTAICPDRFTVIDFRALESLGVQQPVLTVDFYLDYLAACRRLAKQHDIGLRDLDRALWQWSKEKAKKGIGAIPSVPRTEARVGSR